MRCCYFLTDYTNDWISVDIRAVFLFVVLGTPVYIQFMFQRDRQATDLFLKTGQKHHRGTVSCIYSIKDSINVNVSVLSLWQLCAESSRHSTPLAVAWGNNVPNRSLEILLLPSVHSESGCVIRAEWGRDICWQWLQHFHISLWSPALMSQSDSNYKVKAGPLCAHQSTAAWVMSMVFQHTLAEHGS